jgi:hypothetical protein
MWKKREDEMGECGMAAGLARQGNQQTFHARSGE